MRAGLELVAAVGALKTHAPLQTRVGIATGLVVVGDLIGSGASQEQAIVGETPNLAARLQGIAEPNSVVIAESTRKLVGNLFELEDLGAQDLKGIAGPVRAWAALRPGSVEGRFEAMHASGLTELVGREEELELAAAALVKGKDRRRPSCVAFRRSGDRQITADGCAAGTPRFRAAHALALFLLSAAHRQRVVSDHQPDGARRRICARRHRAKQSSTSSMRCWRRARHLQTGRRTLCRNAVAAERRTLSHARTDSAAAPADERLEALTSQIEALSRSNPVLMIFEDAHWIDPTSLEAFGGAVDQIKTLRGAADRNFPARVRAAVDWTVACDAPTLNRLGEREIAAMIDARHRQQGATCRVIGRTSSSAPMAFRCSSRK